MASPSHSWRCLLELNSTREIMKGSPDDLGAAIGRAADLRIGTEFLPNEHIDVKSSSAERVREVAEFGVTYRINNAWSAGVMSLRQPIELPTGFGPRPSMSFFLYNQDGTQGIARPFLDGRPAVGQRGAAIAEAPAEMPKYHIADAWDAETNAPSHNFVYDFDVFRFCVRDDWQQILHHSSDGAVLSGSLEELIEAFSAGCSIKLGIAGLCDSLTNHGEDSIDHEVFVQGGSAYYYMEQKLFMIGTHPVVRVRPAIPMRYSSDTWDFGWLMIRTDGHTVYRRCDPHTLQFTDHVSRQGIRWFVR